MPRRSRRGQQRGEPLETRKATLASLLKRAAPGLRLSEHIEVDGPTVFAHACKYLACAAVQREAEED